MAYKDADGWIYLAGRTADWMRVDGENLAAAPIMTAIVLRDETSLVPEEFEKEGPQRATACCGSARTRSTSWPDVEERETVFGAGCFALL